MKCQNEKDLSAEMINKPSVKKSVIAGFLEEVCELLRDQQDMVRDLAAANELIKTDLLESKSAVIRLQQDILDNKCDQFQSIETAVKCTVQNTVQSELKSCSSVVTENLPPPSITAEKVKEVVQSVVNEEDRSKNLLIFGLSELSGEQLGERVDSVFQALGEKPRSEAVRMGKTSAGRGKPRPVKVTLSE